MFRARLLRERIVSSTRATSGAVIDGVTTITTIALKADFLNHM